MMVYLYNKYTNKKKQQKRDYVQKASNYPQGNLLVFFANFAWIRYLLEWSSRPHLDSEPQDAH